MLHPFIGIGISADLYDRHGRKSLWSSASSGEHHNLCTGAGHSCENLGFSSRGIFDPEAFSAVNPVAVFQNSLNRPMTGFYDSAQAFFLNAGKSAFNISGGRLSASHVFSHGLCPVFHSVYDLIDLLTDRSVRTADGTVCQNVLAAEELGRLPEDHGSSEIHKLVRNISDHGV